MSIADFSDGLFVSSRSSPSRSEQPTTDSIAQIKPGDALMISSVTVPLSTPSSPPQLPAGGAPMVPAMMGSLANTRALSGVSYQVANVPSAVIPTMLPADGNGQQGLARHGIAKEPQKSARTARKSAQTQAPRKRGTARVIQQTRNRVGSPSPSSSSEPPDEEEAWDVEAIVCHKYDPHEAITLYETKWVGYKETTWEPEDMFEDPDTVEDYRRQAGLDVDEDVEDET